MDAHQWIHLFMRIYNNNEFKDEFIGVGEITDFSKPYILMLNIPLQQVIRKV